MSRNEITDELAREGSRKHVNSDGCLTFSEIASRVKQCINTSWRIAPLHEWFVYNRPTAALIKGNSRCTQTALARFRSEHLRIQHHLLGIKVFPPCPICNVTYVAPQHIFTWIGRQKNQLFSSSEEVLTKLKQHGFMDWPRYTYLASGISEYNSNNIFFAIASWIENLHKRFT